MSIKDQLEFIAPAAVAHGAAKVMNALQDEPKGVQVQTMAAAFFLFCDVFGLDPRRELERSERVMHDGDKQFRVEFKALRAYIEGELA